MNKVSLLMIALIVIALPSFAVIRDEAVTDCIKGYVWDNTRQRCVPFQVASDCTNGYVFDSVTQRCIFIQAATDCVRGMIWSEEKQECISVSNTCPVGCLCSEKGIVSCRGKPLCSEKGMESICKGKTLQQTAVQELFGTRSQQTQDTETTNQVILDSDQQLISTAQQRDETSGQTPIRSTTNTCPRGCSCSSDAINCAIEELPTPVTNLTVRSDSRSSDTESNTTVEVRIIKNPTEETLSIQVGETVATTSADVFIKDKKLYVKSEEQEKQVKVFPATASQTAAKTLGNISFTIELKDTGVYELRATKEARLFSVIPLTAAVSTRIDAESGSVVSVNKPWWSFLATGI